jgi:hypothetical protein
MSVVYVPVRTNPKTRESRLIRTIPSFLVLSAVTVIRFYTMYRPLRVFTLAGSILMAGGFALGLRFLYFLVQGTGTGHVQSLILAAVLGIVGFQVLLIGLLADLVMMNRKMLEETLLRARRSEWEDPTSGEPRAGGE